MYFVEDCGWSLVIGQQQALGITYRLTIGSGNVHLHYIDIIRVKTVRTRSPNFETLIGNIEVKKWNFESKL